MESYVFRHSSEHTFDVQQGGVRCPVPPTLWSRSTPGRAGYPSRCYDALGRLTQNFVGVLLRCYEREGRSNDRILFEVS